MKSGNLRDLETELPDLFDRFDSSEWDWPDPIIVVREDDLAEDSHPFDDLFEDDGAIDRPPLALEDLPDLSQVSDILSDSFGSDESWEMGRLGEIVDGLKDNWGGQPWPGQPGGASQASGGQPVSPSADVPAFYLPWHHFNENTWGIYLIIEGIEFVGHGLHFLAHRWLTLAECNRIAKIFLFHHEAYHNAVETFSARLETSHRRPFYTTGLRRLYATVTKVTPHEEALANAYSVRKVRSQAFALESNRQIRKWKREVAFLTLRRYIELSAPPYSYAKDLLPRRGNSFLIAQPQFQEEALAATLGIAKLNPRIWNAAPRALHPSLVRNGAFSYVIGKRHPLANRVKASVRYFDRRKFIQRLKREIPGTIVAGGKHPIYETADGRRIPVPTGKLRIGTADAILKECGLKQRFKSVRKFMQGDRL